MHSRVFLSRFRLEASLGREHVPLSFGALHMLYES